MKTRLGAALLMGLCSLMVGAVSAGTQAQARARIGGEAERMTAARKDEPDAYARALVLYRQQRYGEAGVLLEEALHANAGEPGYRALLGWCYAHQERYAEAEAAFRRVMKENPGSREARQGLAAALAGSGKAASAFDLALALLREEPSDAEALAIATRALAATGRIADRRLGAPLPRTPAVAPARAGTDYLEVLWADRYVPIFVKGINLGVALPGRFPSEFPEEIGVYREWLGQIADLGANAVRTYTLLPPVFYQALREHDEAVLAAARPQSAPPPRYLWLIQGVWTELPEGNRYDDAAFTGSFREEMERIIDVLHGDIAVARSPGHAFGLYRHDVSSLTLALILGREWEPFSVEAYDAARPGGAFEGRYFSMTGGTAMEAWVASMMDHAVAYEARRYGTMRPVAFTNWPTLDPLRHPTEATKAEEADLTRRLGLPFEPRAVREYDNDAAGIDAGRIRASAEARAGHFASYHAYPYYPDFMNLDPGYLRARDARGPNNYLGYLRDLKAHHAGLPVLIAEIGVPTSRGVAHVQPQGLNHGGHDEVAQGEIDARLMETIHEAECAGGILFAWLDEWFKRNWLVMDFESPAERNPKWLNVLDPEQNYGLLAVHPGHPAPRIVLDGRGEDWDGLSPLVSAVQAPEAVDPRDGTGSHAASTLRALWATHDEAYLYLRLDVEGSGPGGGAPPWDRAQILIGIDTYGEREGDTRFPYGIEAQAPTGMEFMVDLAGENSSRLLVDTPYDLHTHRFDRPYRSVPNEDGRYIEILVETNRRRIGRDGTIYPAILDNRSPLRFGTTDPNAPAYDSLADWYAGAGAAMIEIRLPWGLLNVTDPSSHRVVDDPAGFGEQVGTRATDGFRLYAVARDPRGGRLIDTLPRRGADGRLAAAPSTLYAWAGWEEPSFHTRLKRSYFIIRDRWAALPGVVVR